MKKNFFRGIIALIVCISFTACKKESARNTACQIITASSSSPGSTSLNFTYNSQKQLSTYTSGTSTTTFTYAGNTVVAATTSSGTFSSKKIITLGANGLAANVKTEYNTAGTNWYNSVLDYSGTELIKSTGTSSSDPTPDIQTYAWSNGNMVSVTFASSVTSLDYFTDKESRPGDYLQLAQLIDGYEIYKTKNVLKSISSGSDITNFDYTYDVDGKIITITVTSSTSAETINCQYQCN